MVSLMNIPFASRIAAKAAFCELRAQQQHKSRQVDGSRQESYNPEDSSIPLLADSLARVLVQLPPVRFGQHEVLTPRHPTLTQTPQP